VWEVGRDKAINERGKAMKIKCIGFLFTLLFALGSASVFSAGVGWKVQQTFKMDQPPLDVAVSPDGRHVFVLTRGGTILVYAQDGNLEDRIQVGNHADQIKIGPKGERLFITNQKDKTVQVIKLDFIFDINVSRSPFKGPRDAPVVIAVFSEFQ